MKTENISFEVRKCLIRIQNNAYVYNTQHCFTCKTYQYFSQEPKTVVRRSLFSIYKYIYTNNTPSISEMDGEVWVFSLLFAQFRPFGLAYLNSYPRRD